MTYLDDVLRWLSARESSALVQKETATKDGTLRPVGAEQVPEEAAWKLAKSWCADFILADGTRYSWDDLDEETKSLAMEDARKALADLVPILTASLIKQLEEARAEREDWRGKAERYLSEWRNNAAEAEEAVADRDEADAAKEMWRGRAEALEQKLETAIEALKPEIEALRDPEARAHQVVASRLEKLAATLVSSEEQGDATESEEPVGEDSPKCPRDVGASGGVARPNERSDMAKSNEPKRNVLTRVEAAAVDELVTGTPTPEQEQLALAVVARLHRWASSTVGTLPIEQPEPSEQPSPEQVAEDSGRVTVHERCNRCGRGCTIWFASSPLWNAVIRGGSIDGRPEFGDMVCATCFMQLAEEKEIATRFRVSADEVRIELETTTPSGRVWDEQQFRWSALDPPAPDLEGVTAPKTFAELRDKFVDPEKEQLRAELKRFRDNCSHRDMTLNADEGTMTCDVCGFTERDNFSRAAKETNHEG